MTRIKQVESNFTAGEVSGDLMGRGDLVAYDNGAQKIRNMFIYPTGGLTRRAGLQYIDTVLGKGRLIPFAFNAEQTFLLVITDGQIDIYFDDNKIETLFTPWGENDIKQLAWTQSADTLLLVHPDYPPKKLLRNDGNIFVLEDWVFHEEKFTIFQPYYKFAKSDVTVTPNDLKGTLTLTASADVFVTAHVGTRLQISGEQGDIVSYISPTQIRLKMVRDLPSLDSTIDWQEQAFSSLRGYPTTVAFHQDRLVIGGSRDLPNRLWLSKSGDLFNFDLGTGLDDEAIEFAILSDQVNAIRGIFSGRHLQIFTSGAEWMVTGSPLTPATVQLNRQTRVGSVIDRYIPPVTVDGATVFIGRDGQEIREFLYTDIEQAYTAVDLALASRHIPKGVIDQDYDPRRRLVFVVRDDGKFATMTFYRAEQVRAWTLHDTKGFVHAVTVVGEDVYLLIERENNFFIEKFNEDMGLDSALSFTDIFPKTIWTGLDHLEGQNICIVADDIALPQMHLVINGQIILDDAAKKIAAGLKYTNEIIPLPPPLNERLANRKIRLIEGLFRLQNSQILELDVGQGLRSISLKQCGQISAPNIAPAKISGDVKVRALGWQNNCNQPLWRIKQDDPYHFTLLAVSLELKIND